MKIVPPTPRSLRASLCAALWILSAGFGLAAPLGTAFTYQGRLTTGTSPANGNYDLQFKLFDALTNGVQQGGTVTSSAVAVSNGLFTVALDFGSVFDGSARWLEIAVQTNGGAAFSTLAPRQSLTAAPYATYAPSAGAAASATVAGAVAAANISGTIALAQLPGAVVTNNATGTTLTGNFFGNFGGSFFGAGSGLTGLSPASLSPGTAAINISGNATTATTATTAANLTGNVADGQIPANLARLNGTNNFTGTNTFAGVTLATNVNNVLVGSFTGSGAGLTNLSTAQFANAVLTNTQSGVTLSGTFSGNGASLTNLNASQLTTGTVPDARIAASVARTNQVWLLNGNSGTTAGVNFIGTTDGQPVEFKVGGSRVLRLDYGGLIAGTPNNSSYSFSTSIGGGDWNSADYNSDYAVIAGGRGNIMSYAGEAVIGGGRSNTLQTATDSVIAGGMENYMHLSPYSVIGGGYGNVIDGSRFPDYSYIYYCMIPGGYKNQVSGICGLAAGCQAQAIHDGSFVWADLDFSGLGFASTGTNQFLIRARGGVGINKNNLAATLDVNGTVRVNDNDLYLRGDSNHGLGWYGAAKPFGSATPDGPVVYGYGGGALGTFRSGVATNVALSWNSSGNVGIGKNNPATALDVNGTVTATSFSGSFSGSGAGLSSVNADQLDGQQGTFYQDASNVNAGTLSDARLSANVALLNANPAFSGTVAAANFALSPPYGDVKLRNDEFHGLGWYGTGKLFAGVNVNGSVLYGGSGGALGTTGSGQVLALTWDNSGKVGIGKANPATTLDVNGEVSAPVVTTSQLRLTGARTVISGFDGNGSHWFGPSPDNDLAFELRRIAANAYAFTLKGDFYGVSFNPTSDRNAKENFQAVNPQTVLEKVAALPISEWTFKGDASTPHIGPMAQDFHAAFGVGPDDKHIATVDADGVALAAIQGLNQKLETALHEKDTRIAELEQRNHSMESRLAALEKAIQSVRENVASNSP